MDDELAWGQCQDDEPLVWPRRWTVPLALVMAAMAVLAACILAFGHEVATADITAAAVLPPLPVAISPAPPPPVVMPSVPSIPALPDVQQETPPPPPPAPPPPAWPAAADQRLLDNLRSLGYVITNPALVVHNAHTFCELLQKGESTYAANDQIQALTAMNTTDTLELTSSAMLTEPNCY